MSVAPSIAFLGNVGLGPAEIVAVAQEAERRGWEGTWMIEYEYDSFAFDQAIAMGTGRVTTGSCITRAFTRHPLLVAQTATVIDLLAPGRFVIGLGTGGVTEPPKDEAAAARSATEARPSVSLQRWGQPSERMVARMAEYTEVVKLALAGEPMDYAGEFFQFQVTPSLRPTGRVPVYLAGGGEKLQRVAGRVADGVFLWLAGERMTADAIARVREAEAASGRPGGEVGVGCLIPTCAHEDVDAARDAVRRTLVDYYLGRAHYAHVLGDCGYPEVGAAVSACVERGAAAEASAAIPDEALDQLAIWGTPERCRELYRRFVARGLDLPILYVFPADGDWLGAYRGAIEHLAPSRIG